jgi:hypothetical protein
MPTLDSMSFWLITDGYKRWCFVLETTQVGTAWPISALSSFKLEEFGVDVPVIVKTELHFFRVGIKNQAARKSRLWTIDHGLIPVLTSHISHLIN